jgi:hypothetical protein
MVDPRVREENWKGWGWEHQRKKRRGGGAIDGEISSDTVGMEERENKKKRVSDGFLGGGWKREKVRNERGVNHGKVYFSEHMTKDKLSTKKVTPNWFGGVSSKPDWRKTLSFGFCW